MSNDFKMAIIFGALFLIGVSFILGFYSGLTSIYTTTEDDGASKKDVKLVPYDKLLGHLDVFWNGTQWVIPILNENTSVNYGGGKTSLKNFAVSNLSNVFMSIPGDLLKCNPEDNLSSSYCGGIHAEPLGVYTRDTPKELVRFGEWRYEISIYETVLEPLEVNLKRNVNWCLENNKTMMNVIGEVYFEEVNKTYILNHREVFNNIPLEDSSRVSIRLLLLPYGNGTSECDSTYIEGEGNRFKCEYYDVVEHIVRYRVFASSYESALKFVNESEDKNSLVIEKIYGTLNGFAC